MKYEVVIVGAGPAGSTAAKLLSEKGIRVLLIDKDKFPRYKPCGGGISYRVLERFPYIKDKNLIESYSYGGIVISPSKNKATLKGKEPVGAMVIRNKFDMGLVQKAVDKNTNFIDEKTVINVKILKDKAKIILKDKTEIESEIVIGADGVRSIIAKKSRLKPRNIHLGVCVLNEYNFDEEVIDEFFTTEKLCYFHLKFHDIHGYGWVFPKKRHLNIGIGKINPNIKLLKTEKNLVEIYRKYINTLKKSKIIPNNLKIGKCKGGTIPIIPLEKTYSDRIILCGDSSGFVNPFTGEGIYYAMVSGEIASKVILEAIEKNDTSEQFLSRYQTNWQNDFGKDLKMLFKLSYNWDREIEKLIILLNKDKKFKKYIFEVLHGKLSINEYKWKIIIRYLYAFIKEKIGLNSDSY
jgi:geranylgeranyl reductase family protein